MIPLLLAMYFRARDSANGAIKRISAYDDASELESHLPKTAHCGINSMAAEWKKSGKDEPQAVQD